MATDTSGNFVVVWESQPYAGNGQDGSRSGVFGQRYDSSGTPQGPEFQVNSYTIGYQATADVATDAAGNFVVVWESFPYSGNGQDGSGSGVFGQRYDSSGTPQGPEFQVNTYTTGPQGTPHVATDTSGNFVVVWQSGSSFDQPTQDGSAAGIFGQRYDSTGTPAPGRVPVGATILGFTDRGATMRRVNVSSADPSVANGINPVINPVTSGAFLHIFNNTGSGDSACLPLPAGGWVAVDPDRAIYRYSDPTFANGPCKRVIIKRARSLRAKCQSTVQPIPYSLDETMQGSVGANLTIGPATYCAVFGGSIVTDSGATGVFRAREAPAPTSCPTPPTSCP